MQFKHTQTHGFTVLYSVLTASLLLAIALAVYNISAKELILSSTARDSQFAFYAADAALECAIYWDFVHDAFVPGGGDVASGDCGGNSFPTDMPPYTGNESFMVIPNTGTFTYFNGEYCAHVEITKIDLSPGTRTELLARGYTCDTENSRRVERALQATY
jgi:hypothetical protein